MPCATRDDANIDIANAMNELNVLNKQKLGKMPQRFLTERLCLQELSQRIYNNMFKRIF